MGYQNAKEQLIYSRAAGHVDWSNYYSIDKDVEDEEYLFSKPRKVRAFKPHPGSQDAIVQRRINRVVAAAANPRIAEVLRGIVLNDIDRLVRVRSLVAYNLFS